MRRFLGIKNNCINIISDKPFINKDILTIEVPAHLENISNIDLITNYKFRNNELCSKTSIKEAKYLKIALVGNFKMKCGVSTYSEILWAEIVKRVGDFKLFIEKNDNPTGPINELGGKIIPDDKVTACWKRGESLQQLISEIKKYNPDVIHLQHEFGIWPNAMYWLSLMTQLSDYRVIVTMHSVFHHKDKTICEAAMPEIVTHLQGGYNVLKLEKQISGKVHVIPHGCFPCTDKNRLWNFYKSEHTFMQLGFGFRYKNFQNSIKAVAALKEKYPDVFFTGLFSESTSNGHEHKTYYEELIQLIDQLGIQENVAILRGFQSDATLDSYLRTNKVAVFPYLSEPNHEVFGASGAARLAMSTNIAVITSSIPHFSDLPGIKADSPEEIANQLDILFSNKKVVEDQLLKQQKYLIENSWENIAKRYIELFESPCP